MLRARATHRPPDQLRPLCSMYSMARLRDQALSPMPETREAIYLGPQQSYVLFSLGRVRYARLRTAQPSRTPEPPPAGYSPLVRPSAAIRHARAPSGTRILELAFSFAPLAAGYLCGPGLGAALLSLCNSIYSRIYARSSPMASASASAPHNSAVSYAPLPGSTARILPMRAPLPGCHARRRTLAGHAARRGRTSSDVRRSPCRGDRAKLQPPKVAFSFSPWSRAVAR